MRNGGQRGRFGAAAWAAALLAVFLIRAFPAGAAEGGNAMSPEELGRRPIEITADRLSADTAGNSVTFEGNVKAVQGDVTLYADRLFARYSRGAHVIEKIEAEGNVRVVQGAKEARAAHAVFYNLEQRIVLTGGAELDQGDNSLKGDTVTIYLRENRSVVTSGEGGRVRAVIHPKQLLEKKGTEGR